MSRDRVQILFSMQFNYFMYNPTLKEWWIIEGKPEWLREHQRFQCQWLTSILCSPVMQPVQGWVYIQQCNRGWMRPTACFLVRAKGGSQLTRPYSSLIGLRSLPVAPPALLHGCPISGALREPPPLSMHWADSGYSYRATGDCQLSLSILISLSLSLSLLRLCLTSVLRCHHPVPVHS